MRREVRMNNDMDSDDAPTGRRRASGYRGRDPGKRTALDCAFRQDPSRAQRRARKDRIDIPGPRIDRDTSDSDD